MSPLVEWWAVSRTLPGQEESGDRYLVQEMDDGVLLAAVDGLGHGREAASAAKEALTTLERHVRETLQALVYRCHGALRGTRGAVMSLGYYNQPLGTLTWIGVGNVEGLVLQRNPGGLVTRRLVTRGGVIGNRLPVLSAATFPVHPGDVLVFATDGIAGGFDSGLDPRQPPQAMAEAIIARHGRVTDDALVLVARLCGDHA